MQLAIRFVSYSGTNYSEGWTKMRNGVQWNINSEMEICFFNKSIKQVYKCYYWYICLENKNQN